MKTLVNVILIIQVLAGTAFGQFKNALGGFAFEAKAAIAISGYSLAGGGVILKAKAKPSDDAALIDFSDVNVTEDVNGNSILSFTTALCDVSLSDKSWLLRDAAMLVHGEIPGVLVRDVNLLGKPAAYEDSIRYPRERYFYVEMNKSLIGTKSGEMLLLVDILQTNIAYYSDKVNYIQDSISYSNAYSDLLEKTIANTNKVIDGTREASEMESALLITMVEIFAAVEKGEISELEAEELVVQIHSPSNWTYNDEYRDLKFSASCSSKTVTFSGRPRFTFLTMGYDNVLFTKYFQNNSLLIRNLRSQTFKDAERFASVAAFFRYLKRDDKLLWSKIVSHFSAPEFDKKNPKYRGNTPRLIEK